MRENGGNRRKSGVNGRDTETLKGTEICRQEIWERDTKIETWSQTGREMGMWRQDSERRRRGVRGEEGNVGIQKTETQRRRLSERRRRGTETQETR